MLCRPSAIIFTLLLSFIVSHNYFPNVPVVNSRVGSLHVQFTVYSERFCFQRIFMFVYLLMLFQSFTYVSAFFLLSLYVFTRLYCEQFLWSPCLIMLCQAIQGLQRIFMLLWPFTVQFTQSLPFIIEYICPNVHIVK